MAALGARNVARVAWYRASVRFGVNKVRRIKADVPSGPFFLGGSHDQVGVPPSNGWDTEGRLFGYIPFPVADAPPEWLSDPIDGARYPSGDADWWTLPDFDPAVGDIKRIWELSRFDWSLPFAQRARLGDRSVRDRLNNWIADWLASNPPYRGPNWKCGQEASIRVMHLATAALILGEDHAPTKGFRDLIRLHMQRIAPTMSYALAQDNNHGVSEAVALFVGGTILSDMGEPGATEWERTGRRRIEERAARLIGADGSFSQYSVNYHRLVLDAFCLAEVWRRRHGRAPFSTIWQQRLRVASEWLRRITDPRTGDAPNLGANDGARLLSLADTDYRDYRPTVQTATALFAGRRAFSEAGVWDHAAVWLGIELPNDVADPPISDSGGDGGFAVLRRGEALAVLRYPHFRFRPSQADSLHLDLSYRGRNVLRDAGSFSYNSGAEWIDYFNGTRAHNTIEFDGRDQMPRLGRFLFSDWLATDALEPIRETARETSFAAGYRDRWGARHFRRVRLFDDGLCVEDAVSGFSKCAVLRWRLAPGQWAPAGNAWSDGQTSLSAMVADRSAEMKLTTALESRYYFQKSEVPVLELRLTEPGRIVTEVKWTG